MLRQAARSVLSQTFADLELIIVPNAATAQAIDAARDIAARHADVSVVVLSRGHLAGARNAGLRAARGEWIAFLDDDDLWLPTKIEEQVREARASGADLIICDVIAFDARGPIGPMETPTPPGLTIAEALTIYDCLPGSASGALVRVAALRSLGGFDEAMPACEDWDMWRRLCWRHKVSRVPTALAMYRVHHSMSRKRALMFRGDLHHLVKMTFDTPRHLRHALWRGWRERLWRLTANGYAALDRATGGLAGSTYRTMRRIARALGT